eukprot:7149840-Prymnesium_polylepis.3
MAAAAQASPWLPDPALVAARHTLVCRDAPPVGELRGGRVRPRRHRDAALRQDRQQEVLPQHRAARAGEHRVPPHATPH